MDVSRIRALRGPNLWSRHTAIQAIVRCDGAEVAIADLPGFEARLRERFPELGDLIPSDHLDTVSVAHALEFCALGLQAQAGCPVTFSRTTQTVDTGVFQVVVEYSEEDVARLAFERAEQLCQAALDDTPFDLEATLKELRDLDEDIRLGPSTGAIVSAAVARGIPFRRLTQGSLVQFGWGSKQKRIQAAETSFTSAIAEAIAQDKELTKNLLHASGVAVPYGRPVEDEDDAWAAAQEVGLPVVAHGSGQVREAEDLPVADIKAGVQRRQKDKHDQRGQYDGKHIAVFCEKRAQHTRQQDWHTRAKDQNCHDINHKCAPVPGTSDKAEK